MCFKGDMVEHIRKLGACSVIGNTAGSVVVELADISSNLSSSSSLNIKQLRREKHGKISKNNIGFDDVGYDMDTYSRPTM